jgi:DNA-binding CsgD family transcriptional regulator
MEKVNKQTEIKKLLAEGKSVKEIAELLKTNVAYVYKLKRQTSKDLIS